MCGREIEIPCLIFCRQEEQVLCLPHHLDFPTFHPPAWYFAFSGRNLICRTLSLKCWWQIPRLSAQSQRWTIWQKLPTQLSLSHFQIFFTFLLFLMFISLNCQQCHSFLSDLQCQRNCSFMSLENWVIGYFAARTANMVEAFAKEVAIWRLNLTNWPICQAVSGYRWHLGAWRPPRHDRGQVQCTM